MTNIRPEPPSLHPAPQVGVHYDPMIAKVVAHAADRPSALRTLHAALGQLQVGGRAGRWVDACVVSKSAYGEV